ncbi:16S rRNA (cytosine(1402)-N(4))-methyltransferase RsmH [Paremcibacter congregatus]|uniref:Ribosomal RNA small subunit methyltransferase H n=1 Tax=Paremcibacter congregatus TaxID=2043170 RepID=A0A2G4YTD3_9PROT|nr:16S rRNA (cytosine(1402)-N(4))-methyltransferase RsmH [Paremcibacter congregatus]PHZ85591.1 16S rRNA (cytosine(1402)-N(4))-methyltransferase [Paremcibacter congregatus]QDE26549.1 16S rRNA (cytosine(1402)-N(4))-methyltransferase RsmH [Paremcibacter congregatus]
MTDVSFDPRHYPVMRNEVLDMAAPQAGEVFVDGTFGAGGYSRALLETADCIVYAIDRDPNVQATADKLAAEFPGRFHLLAGCFSQMDQLLDTANVAAVDGVLLDIGVSSMQFDDAERGFSFQNDGPLSMRMSDEGLSAEDVVNDTEETELANIIYQYGEERKSRRIAKAICEARAQGRINRTTHLANIIEKAVGYQRYIKGKKQIHPATRTFQALRIYVNDELGELEKGLLAAEKILAPGGRLCVVSFHSLEDRIVKKFFKARSGAPARGSRHLPEAMIERELATAGSFEMIARGAVKPGKTELDQNPRSRSAKLRGARRTATAPWSGEGK